MRIAEELGVDAEIVLYLKTPPDRETLGRIIDRLEDPVTDLVRRDSLWAARASATRTRRLVTR